jgi:hypothetical protein
MEKVRVPSKRTVKFKIGRLMKEQLYGDEQGTSPRPHTSVARSDRISMPGGSPPG